MSVFSGNLTIQKHGEVLIEELDLSSPAHLILDAPWGYALFRLALCPSPKLVLTGNVSPHYLRDLLDFKPEGLLAKPASPDEVRQALMSVAQGERFYQGPSLNDKESLTICERQALRLVAFGLENSQVARQLQVSEKTIANRITNIREKLNLQNRVEISMYYLGTLPRLWDKEDLTVELNK